MANVSIYSGPRAENSQIVFGTAAPSVANTVEIRTDIADLPTLIATLRRLIQQISTNNLHG